LSKIKLSEDGITRLRQAPSMRWIYGAPMM
jgi:hypothetical protein